MENHDKMASNIRNFAEGGKFLILDPQRNKQNYMCGVIQSLSLEVNNVLYQTIYYVNVEQTF